LHELGKRWRHKKVLAEQKTSQLGEWFEEAQREIASSFRFAKPQRKPRTQRAKMGEAQAGPKLRKAAKSFADVKNVGRLRAPRKAASVWEKRLRSWLSLSP
jgi:hypothetical protein